MPSTRHCWRTARTQDLSARLTTPGAQSARRRVLNISQAGMLVTGGGLAVGDRTTFELSGPDFTSSGVAEVTRSTNAVTGLRFVDRDGSADILISTRVSTDLLHAASHITPGCYLG